MDALLARHKPGKERCGFVLDNGEIVEVPNVASEPENAFAIDASDIVKWEGQAVATWHTHPRESSNLSNEDYRGFLNYPNLRHYIVGTDGVSSYTVKSGIILRDEG